MQLLSLRGASTPFLLGLLLLVAACDSGDPSEEPAVIDPEADLFLLEPTYFSNVNFPAGGRGPLRYLEPLTSDFTFEVESSDFGSGATVMTSSQAVDLASMLTEQGYSDRSVAERNLPGNATLSLEAPAGTDMSFLDYVTVYFAADGLSDRAVGGRSYFYNGETEVEFSLDSYYARDYLSQPGFRVYLVLDAYNEPSTAGTYRFDFSFDVQFRVYDGDPAPSEVTFERELYLRDALQYEGFDVGDVVSARVTEVGLMGDYGSSDPTFLAERIDAVHIRAGSPETEEMEDVAVMQDFEEEADPYYGGTRMVTRAGADVDMTAAVRRTGRLLIGGVLDLNEAAGVRGESYQTVLEVEVAFEVPVPVGPRSEDGERTAELRVPMRVPVSIEK